MLAVVKIGGSTLEEGLSQTVVEDLENTLSRNEVVLVHGGGAEVTEFASKLGFEQKFVVSPRGFRSRYTDKETAEVYTMVMVGKINKQLVSALESRGIPAVGLSGLDGSLIKAERKKHLIVLDERGRRKLVDGDYSGKIVNINASLLKLLLTNGYVPVVAPVAMGNGFEHLNVDGDRAAAYIGAALKADVLVLLTDVDGVEIDGKLISKLTTIDAKEVLPKIGHGMITKIYAAIEALENGVKKVVIANGLEKAPISSSLESRCGTVISNE